MASNGWKTRTLVVGSVVGAVAGVVAAQMFIKSSEEAGPARRGRPRVEPKSVLQVGIGLMALLQKIAGLADA